VADIGYKFCSKNLGRGKGGSHCWSVRRDYRKSSFNDGVTFMKITRQNNRKQSIFFHNN